MTSPDKQTVINRLHNVQEMVHTAHQLLGDVKVHSTADLKVLEGIYGNLLSIETELARILDEDWWDQHQKPGAK